MLKKIELDSLRAELSLLNDLLESRTKEEDPIGWFQYSKRKDELEKEIANVEIIPDSEAAVGLFFGGRPVVGSKGIASDFAVKALEQFQDIVAKRFASITSGPLGSTGPIPLREKSQLMITDVARGSFGFILEELPEEKSIIDTPLKQVVEEMAELIYKVTLEEDDFFDSVADTVDDRLLGTLKSFMKWLDDAGATLRIVEGQKEYSLKRDDIQRGRIRTETMEIAEEDEASEGRLYILAEARRFELKVEENRPVIRGMVSKNFIDSLLSAGPDELANILGRRCEVQLRVREVREKNRNPRIAYTLLNAQLASR